MSLKKTLFLTEYYPPSVGGSCNMFAWRAKLYPPDKMIVLTRTVPQSDEFDRQVAYQLRRVPLPRKGPKGFEWLNVVWGMITHGMAIVRRERVEVIQCGRPFPEGFAGYVIAKMLRKKLVINSLGDDIAMYENYPVERILMQLAIRGADMNLAISAFTEGLVKRHGGRDEKIGRIPPGFDPSLLPTPSPEQVAELRQRLGGSHIILTVGRLQRRKGQDQIIHALPQILQRFPDVKYVIVGPLSGWPPNFIETIKQSIADLGVGEHVILAGEIPWEQLPLYYKACDIFIMPNRLVPPGDVEGFGIVFLEASYLEKPVIGGNSGGAPDAMLHGETGLLVDGSSTEEIAHSVLSLLSDPQRAEKMGKRGKEFAITMSHENVFVRYQELLTKFGL